MPASAVDSANASTVAGFRILNMVFLLSGVVGFDPAAGAM
jgi:hypothetical protein